MAIRVPKDLTECQSFFLEPANPKHRLYEALRAYFVEERESARVAEAFGYTPGSFRVLCHHFRRDPDPLFFVKGLPGPRSQPKKSAARDIIVRLRKQNHSVYEISEALKEQKIGLSPTAVVRGVTIIDGRGITVIEGRRPRRGGARRWRACIGCS